MKKADIDRGEKSLRVGDDDVFRGTNSVDDDDVENGSFNVQRDAVRAEETPLHPVKTVNENGSYSAISEAEGGDGIRSKYLGIKSASTGTSPTKVMERCMFNFPVPPPRMWTILVEPITHQVTDQPKLHSWRPASSFDHFDTNDCNVSSSKRSRKYSVPNTPRRLNGSGDDNDGSRSTRGRRGGQILSNERSDGPRVFTFVSDKRMNVSMTSVIREPSDKHPSKKSSYTKENDVDQVFQEKCKPCTHPRKGRRGEVHKTQLTFHQLEFNCDTLKSFDRSVFVVNSTQDNCNGAKQRSIGKKTAKSRVLAEAAEILLGLRDASDPSSSFSTSDEIESLKPSLHLSPCSIPA